MRKQLLFGLLVLVFMTLPILAACTGTSTTKTSATAAPPQISTALPQTSTSAVTTKTTTAPTAVPTATMPPTTSTAITTKTANWWVKFGEPQYGGTINYRVAMLDPIWDVGNWLGNGNMLPYETLWHFDWTLDRSVNPLNFLFVPAEYYMGWLAESWQQTDPATYTVKLRQGVKWQNIAPANGREFTADDVVYRYDRELGTGSGFTTPEPMHIGRTGALQKVTATDKYTVVFKFKYPTAIGFYTLLEDSAQNYFQPPETIKPGTTLTDWKQAIGTGPWIVSDLVSGTSITYNKNPDYWAYDPRYPKNKLPYADTIKILVIPDTPTALAAIRTGKLEMIDTIPWEQASSMAKTNPELVQSTLPIGGPSAEMRVDTIPFKDIRVRKALNMAIDRKALNNGLYGGTATGIPCGYVSGAAKGYCYAYDDWPQTLKDEYAFNPTAAKQLLKDAGYPNGFNTNIITNASGVQLNAMQAIKSYFNDIGVNMEIRVYAGPAWSALVQAGKYDQMVQGNRSGADTGPISAIGMRTSKNTGNWHFNNDAAYDSIFNDANAATTMEDARKLIVAADKYGIEHFWNIPTFMASKFTITQPYLKGYSGEVLGRNPGWAFSLLWLNK